MFEGKICNDLINGRYWENILISPPEPGPPIITRYMSKSKYFDLKCLLFLILNFTQLKNEETNKQKPFHIITYIVRWQGEWIFLAPMAL